MSWPIHSTMTVSIHFDFDGGDDTVDEDPNDNDDTDLNNYKGIYAEDDAG